MYPSAPQPNATDRKDELQLLSSSISVLSPSPSLSSYLNWSLSFEASSHPISTYMKTNRCSNTADALKGPSNSDLFQHYLKYTSHTLSLCQSDHNVLQIGMPTLALQSETVFHSLLAVSAASLAWNMIFKKPPTDTDTVNQVLLTGYQHYNLASEQMRQSISGPGALEPEPLLASALILVPFTTASQQINHWISSRSVAEESHKLLSSTPRDVIIIIRGIRTIFQTLDCGILSTNVDLSQKMECELDRSLTSSTANPQLVTPAPSRTHVMSAMVAATSQSAFFKLQKRLESTLLYQSDYPNHSLSVCNAAFEILDQIRSSAFCTINSSPSPLPSISSRVTDTLSPEPKSFSRISPWLRSFASRSFVVQSTTPQPTEPLTRFLLSFLVQVPQEYLDLVLPLLDQRLENPMSASSGRIPAELTQMQALALDIYAHWSVLMFLVEEESWWIGTLPVVTLAGMVNQYGDGFISRLWPENGPEKGQWWPGSMLNIFRDIKRYINEIAP
jgi:hypothetical protein